MTKTECYKCHASIEVEHADQVHPLCEACDNSFAEWLNNLFMEGSK